MVGSIILTFFLSTFQTINLISSISFHSSLFSFPFVEFICLFVNDATSFYFSNLGYGCEKHENYKKIMSMLKHGGLTFKV
jgi:hypothetical protein